MDINEGVKSRPDLKLYFVKNAIPTESNFADLIDSVPNQREDGFVKSSGEPLSIEAGGGASSQKRAINCCWNFSDDKPHWVLSLNPRARPSSAATAKQGFSISDAEGHSRLFIQPSGNVGVSTVSPAAKLDILGGRWDVSNTEGDLRVGNEQFRFKVGVALAGGGKGDVRLRAHGGTNRMMLGSGDADVLTISNGNVGIGTLEPKIKLHVNGPIHTTGEVRALGGVRVDGNLAQHVETDGAFYRHGGQVHINVDDNLYIRDTRRDNAFHFDTNRSILLAAGIRVDKTVAQHIEADGAFYRFGGKFISPWTIDSTFVTKEGTSSSTSTLTKASSDRTIGKHPV